MKKENATMEAYKQLLKNCLVVIDSVLPMMEQGEKDGVMSKETVDKVRALQRTGYMMLQFGDSGFNPASPENVEIASINGEPV